jgi:hypothetical protein
MRKFLLVLLALLVLAAAAAAIYWQRSNAVMRAPGPHAEAVLLDVPAGATVRSVLAELETRGALADRRAVELQLRVRGSPQIKTGKYEIACACQSGTDPAAARRRPGTAGVAHRGRRLDLCRHAPRGRGASGHQVDACVVWTRRNS